MTAMDRVAIGAMGDTPGDMAEMARRAEQAGFDSVWAIELFRNAFTQTTWLASQTEKADIGTSIGIAAIVVGMLIVAGTRLKHLLVLTAVGVVL